jgi:hypothetical protein
MCRVSQVSFHASKGSEGHLSGASAFLIMLVISLFFSVWSLSYSWRRSFLHRSRRVSGSSRFQYNLIEVTPEPIFSGLEGPNNRVIGRMEMLRGVLILG